MWSASLFWESKPILVHYVRRDERALIISLQRLCGVDHRWMDTSSNTHSRPTPWSIVRLSKSLLFHSLVEPFESI